jgi:hypothetical protein
MMKQTFLRFLLVFVASAAELSTLSAALSAQGSGTKTNREDSLTFFIITNSDLDTGKAAEKVAEIREIIWRHWRQRKIGSLMEERYSKEGEPTKTTFTFGNDHAGVWSLLVARHWPKMKGADEAHTRVEYRVYAVRRIGDRNEDVPEDAVRSGSTFRLVFYDVNGIETGSS